MQIIVFDEQAFESLRTLRAYAEANPFTAEEQEARMLVQDNWAPGDSPDYSRLLPGGVKVVLTIDRSLSGQPVRHVSMGVNGQPLHLEMAKQLIPLLGFQGGLRDCYIDTETEPQALNIYQYVSPQPPATSN